MPTFLPMKLNTGTGPQPAAGHAVARLFLHRLRSQSLRPSSRGGVPVFRRPCGSFSSFRRADSDHGRRVARPARRIVVQPHMDLAVQKRACR